MQTVCRIKFDSCYHDCTGDQAYDRAFLDVVEQYINEIIRVRGYIYLNLIYESLGCEWNPDDRNVCIRAKVEGKTPFVHFSGLYEPDGTLSAVDILLYY